MIKDITIHLTCPQTFQYHTNFIIMHLSLSYTIHCVSRSFHYMIHYIACIMLTSIFMIAYTRICIEHNDQLTYELSSPLNEIHYSNRSILSIISHLLLSLRKIYILSEDFHSPLQGLSASRSLKAAYRHRECAALVSTNPTTPESYESEPVWPRYRPNIHEIQNDVRYEIGFVL